MHYLRNYSQYAIKGHRISFISHDSCRLSFHRHYVTFIVNEIEMSGLMLIERHNNTISALNCTTVSGNFKVGSVTEHAEVVASSAKTLQFSASLFINCYH